MKFRQHRGGLDESMSTLIEIHSKEELIIHCKKAFPYLCNIDEDHLSIKKYCDKPDERIGWDKTFIVILQDQGPLGFTDSMQFI